MSVHPTQLTPTDEQPVGDAVSRGLGRLPGTGAAGRLPNYGTEYSRRHVPVTQCPPPGSQAIAALHRWPESVIGK
jgi:hypothetical protein